MEPVTDLEIIVPIAATADSDAIHRCLGGIAANTVLRAFQITCVVLDEQEKTPLPLRTIPAPSWVAVHYGTELVPSVMAAIENATGIYVAVMPLDHAIDDKGWFGKMQLPFLRTPQCGLTVAYTSAPAGGSGMQPFAWSRPPAPGSLVVAPRQTLVEIARAPLMTRLKYVLSYPDALIQVAKSLGLVTYAIPGVRIDIAGAEYPAAACPRPE